MSTFSDIASLLEDFSKWQEEHQICHLDDGADHFEAHPEKWGNPEDHPECIVSHADLAHEYIKERGPIIINRMGNYPEPRPRAHPEPLPHCDPGMGFHVPMCGHGANIMGRLPDDPEPEDFASRMGHPGGHFG